MCVLIGLTDCGGAVGGVGSSLRGLIETDWEALGGLLGMMEERGGAAAGVIRARMLCAAAPMWCSQQQPAPLCVCLHIQIHAAQGDVMPVRICM